MFRLLIGCHRWVLRGGDPLGFPGSNVPPPTSTVPKKEVPSSPPESQTLPEMQEVRQDQTTVLTPQDTSQVQRKSGIDQELLQEIEERTKKGLPTPDDVQYLEDKSQIIDKFVPPPAPPLPRPRELTTEQVDRIVKSAISLARLPEESMKKLPEGDRQTLTRLVARITGPEQYKPNPDEVKELARISHDLATRARSQWQGTDESTVKPDPAQLKAMDEAISLHQILARDGRYTDAPTAPPAPEPAPGDTARTKLLGMLSTNFKGIVAELDKTHIFTGKVYDKAETVARQMAASITPNSDLARSLAFKSEAELREIVAESMGEIKAKHHGKAFEQLPANKQKLVNAIVEGMKSGLQLQSLGRELEQARSLTEKDAVFQKAVATARQMIASAPPSSDLVFNLTLKTDEELKQSVTASVFGGKQFDRLSVDQQTLVNSIVDGMKEGFPNKASTETVPIKITSGLKAGTERQLPKTFTLNGKTYEKPEFLATGGQGLLIKYTSQDGKESVVLKTPLEPSPKTRQGLVSELTAHRMAMGPEGKGHENIGGLRGAVKGPGDTVYMVSDVIKGPDLKDIVYTLDIMAKNKVLSPTDDLTIRQYLAKGALEGMIYVNEARNMAHFDIKPANIMFDLPSGKVKIMDFGSAGEDRPLSQDELPPMTDDFMAPEAISGPTVDKRYDVFSLGQTLHELVTGSMVDEPVFRTKLGGAPALTAEVLVDGVKKQVAVPTSFGEVINTTFTGTVEARAKLSDLRENPFFTDSLGSDERALLLLDKMKDLISVDRKIAKKEQLELREQYRPKPEELAKDPEYQELTAKRAQLHAELKKMQESVVTSRHIDTQYNQFDQKFTELGDALKRQKELESGGQTDTPEYATLGANVTKLRTELKDLREVLDNHEQKQVDDKFRQYQAARKAGNEELAKKRGDEYEKMVKDLDSSILSRQMSLRDRGVNV